MDEDDSLGWTAFEEAQEPSDAMTIIGAVSRDEEPPLGETPPEPEPQPAPEPAPEPELPPAAEAELESGSAASRGWWRRRHDDNEAGPEQTLPRHVRVLSAADEPARADPWEEGFDGPEAFDESGEPVFVEDEGSRRFRRR
jgi:hypothetical protein